MVQVLPPHARVCQSARVPVSAAFASSQAASSLFRSPPCCPAPQRPCCHLRLSFLSVFPHPSPRCTPHFWRHLTAVTFVASTRPPPTVLIPSPSSACGWYQIGYLLVLSLGSFLPCRPVDRRSRVLSGLLGLVQVCTTLPVFAGRDVGRRLISFFLLGYQSLLCSFLSHTPSCLPDCVRFPF